MDKDLTIYGSYVNPEELWEQSKTKEKTMSQFTSGSQWYYIDNQGFIKDFIIHSGMSPKSAEVLAKVYTVYSDWNEAYKALEEYNKTFNTFIKE